MTARKKTNRKPKSNFVLKRSQARKQSNGLNFEMLERRELLAAITVSNATDILSPTADTSSIAALVANDGGDGISLREAIAASNNTAGEDTVTFDVGVFTGGDDSLIRLTQGELLISDSVSIDGSSVGGVVITGDADDDDITLPGTHVTNVSASFGGTAGASDDLLDDNSRVLDFSGSGDLALTGLTITGGRETAANADGGGIRFNSSGTLSLDQSTVSGNSTAEGGGAGGGISILDGDVSLTNSTISGNSAQSGGGIHSANSAVSLTNSTVSGNTALGRNGGGIEITNGDLSLSNSTVTDNNAVASFGRGGGIAFYASNPGVAQLTVVNSIIAGNTTRASFLGPDLLVYGIGMTGDLTVEYSLIGNSEASMITASTGTGNILDQRPLLAPLANNGGTTQTHALLRGSPAIDAGSNALAMDESGNPLTADQRGGSRVLGVVDIGAFELGTEADFETQSLVVNLSQDVANPFDGLTSLREAIQFANDPTAGVNNDGDADGDGSTLDTIAFDPSVFTSGDNNLIRLTQGELSINDSLNIDGSSVGGVVITGDANDDDITLVGTHITDVSASFGGTVEAVDDLLDDNSRVLDFLTSGNLTLTDLTITGGRATDGNGRYEFSYRGAGGGIRAYNGGDISLFDSTVSGNSATGSYRGHGGGIFTSLGFSPSSGSVSLTDSTVSGNSVGRNSNGGGIASDFVTLTDSIVSGNSTGESINRTGGSGGGIFASSGVTSINSAVTGNSSGNQGGGISAIDVTLTNSAVSGNITDYRGGGISTGNLTSNNSIVSGNSASNRGGGIFLGGGVAFLNNSTVSGNTSGDFGGGFFTTFAELYLTNSTVDGNRSGGDGGGILSSTLGYVSLVNSTLSGNVSGGDGGGIGTYRSTVSVVNSTVTGNSATGLGGGIGFDEFGDEQSLTLYNSVVADNEDGGMAPDVYASLAVSNVQHSLIGDTTGFGITATTGTGNILNELPLLGALADNGGPTWTHALLAASPALNAGSNALANAAGLTTDQRGEARFESGTVDIGSFEVTVETGLLVTTDLDVEDPTDGLISLREAIAMANADAGLDTIIFDPSVFDSATTIVIASQLPTITDTLTITGPGANLLTIDAQAGGDNVFDGNGFRIFEVSDGDSSTSIDVSISSLTLTGGDISAAGGAISNTENLTLDGVSIVDNRAQFGGGVSNELSGVLSLTNSTIANNQASQDGGGISTRGVLTATNVTISGNSAAANGAAIVTAGDSSGSTLNLTQVTLTNNTGNEGVYFNSVDGATTATFNNTIIDSSISGVGSNGTTLAGGYNLFASANPGITGAGNLFNQTSMLGPLADNGGSTLTHALLLGSPAYNAGSTALALDGNGNLLLTDQRGEPRNQFLTVDIGAVENGLDIGRGLVVTTALDVDDPFDGLTSLREAIAIATDPVAGVNNDGDVDGDGLDADTITFDASVFTGGDNNVIRLTQGGLYGNTSLRIDGASVGGIVITGDANGDDVTFPGTNITDVSSSFGGTIGALDDLLDDNRQVLRFFGNESDLTLTGLTITGGHATSNYVDGGGILFGPSNGTLTLNQTIVSGNSLMGPYAGGGGIHSRNGSAVVLIDSTVSENLTTGRNGGGGGIAVEDGGSLSLTNSTVSGNVSSGSGGGILSETGTVTLNNSTVNGNSSDRGAGIFSPFADVILTDSTVSGNVGDGDGGGIYSRYNVVLTGSTASENVSGGNGGGIFSRYGNVSLDNSTVSGNASDGVGGGIYGEDGNVSLTDSTVSGNASGGDGGGIYSEGGNVSLTNSTISGNSTEAEGGGIYSFSGYLSLISSTVNGNASDGVGGGIRIEFGDVTLTNSTVSGNSTTNTGADGGGIYSDNGDLSFIGSTLSGNVSGGSGGGIRAIYGDVSLTNSTLSANTAGHSGGGISSRAGAVSLVNSTVTANLASETGGGIRFENSGFNQDELLTLLNSIVAGNADDGTAPDISNSSSGSELVVESSLIGDTTGSGITFTTGTRNILNQSPVLGPLADNGGPTQTHALLSGSLGVNAGSNSIAVAAGLIVDQRGEDRDQFGFVDIGAFESDLSEGTFFVTTSQDVVDPDDGFISLREAITLSNFGDSFNTIAFDSNVFSDPTTIEILEQLPTIVFPLTITGPGADLLTIDAQGGGDNVLDGNGFRIFEVNDGNSSSSIDVSISGLTLTGGDNDDSGGAISNLENLSLDGVAIVGNRARFGGAVSNELFGRLTLSNSTIANNEASADGGGVFTGGELAATNTTISGNSAAGNGGAIVSGGDSSVVMLSLTNATLTNNSGNNGVYFNNGQGPTVASFNNTIIDSSVTGVGNNGTTLTGGNNLFAGADPGIAGNGNLFNQTSLLGPLSDNGGPTLTHALLYGSPAINAGDSTLAVDENGNPLTTDQRGQDRIRFGAIDIGAVETEFDEARSLVVTTAQDVVDISDRVTSLREAIAFAFAGFTGDGDADGDGLRADTITFDSSVFTGGESNVIRLTQGELSISDSLTIDGSSVGGVVITGDATGNDITVAGSNVTDVSASLVGTGGTSTDLLGDNSRVFDISDSDLFGAANVNLEGLTITGGRATGVENGGGVRFNSSGTLTLNQSTVSGNIALGTNSEGGGIYARIGDVSLTNTTVSRNLSIGDGGGIRTSFGDLSLRNSTISGNISDRDGGGISASFSELLSVNSTVSGNTSDRNGGGIGLNDSTILLANSTVAVNSASRAGGGISFRSENFTVPDRLTLLNSIVTSNTDNGTAPDVAGAVLNDLVVENSLIGDTTGSRITISSGIGNVLNQATLLSPLANNGGPTQTHALPPGSVAINAGSNLIPSIFGLTGDQRDESRIQFGTVDIGAFESDFNERNLVVTTNLDSEDPNDGLTSLREAIEISNAGSEVSTITFDPSVFSVPTTIEISSQLPTITDTLTITGFGANLLTIDALRGGDNILNGNGFRIFEVNDGDANNSVEVSISGLTLTGGDNTGSGGAVSNFENLNLDGVAIVDNRSSFGGGISNGLSGVLTISNSTIANNEASQDGGGIFSGGELAATNTTISSNSAAGAGGAIVSAADSAGVMLSLTHVTLTNNTGSGGVHFNNGSGSTAATFNNTILDASVTTVGNNAASFTGSNNLFADANPGITGTGNRFNQTSLLGPLADNGGPTLTHALLFGSPAINSGDNTLAVDGNGNPLTTDQRGEARIQFGAIDIGAVETEFGESRSLVVTTTQDVVDMNDGVTSLREAIAFAFLGLSGDGDADGDGLSADTITFDASVFAGGDNNLIRLTQGELSIDHSLTIDGSSVGGIVITGDAAGNDILVAGTHVTDVSASLAGAAGTSTSLLEDNSRVFDILDSTLFGAANVDLQGVTVTGGQVESGEHGGGIRFNSSGILALSQSTISGNIATDSTADGGGIYARSGDVSLTDSAVFGNISGRDGGGIRSSNNNLSLTNSTVSGNFSGRDGGGIGISSSNVSLTNSTVSGNLSDRDGGGIWFNDSRVLLVNSTVTVNSASGVGGGVSFRNDDFFQADRLTLRNSIVSGNTDNGTAPDVEAVGVVVNDQFVENSVIGNTTGSGITATSGSGNILNQAALLGPLADNGGSTLTHALLPGSPAIDAGDNTLAVDENGNPLTTDQSGQTRILNGTVDVGAVEFGALPLLGDANLDGNVNFLDISPFISLVTNSTFLNEADVNRDGNVNFLDISPFIALLSPDVPTQPLLGDANLDGGVNFLDISPFISLVTTSTFLDEADINRDEGVNFLDISPFISVLNSGGSSAAMSQSVVVSPPESSEVSPISVAVSEPASIVSVATTVAFPVSTETLLAKQVDAGPAEVSQSIAATESLPQAPLVLANDSLASPVVQVDDLSAVDTTAAVATPVEIYRSPVALAPADYKSIGDRSSSLRSFERNGPLAKQRSLAGSTESLDFSQESSDARPTANVSVKGSFSTAAELFDAHPESLDDVFDFELEESFARPLE